MYGYKIHQNAAFRTKPLLSDESVDGWLQKRITMHRRMKLIEDALIQNFPNTYCEVEYSFDPIGETIIRLFIYLPNIKTTDPESAERATFQHAVSNYTEEQKEFAERDKHVILDWMESVTGQEAKREFREEQGTFFYMARNETHDQDGKYEILMFLERPYEAKCVLKKVEVTKTVYEATCKDTGEKLS